MPAQAGLNYPPCGPVPQLVPGKDLNIMGGPTSPKQHHFVIDLFELDISHFCTPMLVNDDRPRTCVTYFHCADQRDRHEKG